MTAGHITSSLQNSGFRNLAKVLSARAANFECHLCQDRFRARTRLNGCTAILAPEQAFSHYSSASYLAKFLHGLDVRRTFLNWPCRSVCSHVSRTAGSWVVCPQSGSKQRRVQTVFKPMAAQDLLIFDAGECLLGESSSSLFDCLDCETGVDDLLSEGRHPNQVSSPMSSHLMSTLTVRIAACQRQSSRMSPPIGVWRRWKVHEVSL